ncbi:MAG TPA: D-glycerate dehydrogenase [Bryobacteraceae bacterium]|nr:D-glycerate dehydrogenase [Bryobacteraceae bacterium]
MARPQILITKRVFPETLVLLEAHADVDYVATDEGLTPEELLARTRGKQVIVSQITDRLSRDVISQLDGVRIIAQIAVGYDNIDVAAATEAGILVTNTPGVLTDTTADLAFALMLAAGRRIAEGHEFVHAGRWKRWTVDLMIGRDIHHRTLGILGMGRIGQAVARRGIGFSIRVLYHDQTRLAPELERELNAEFVSMERVLSESDFVSIHVPLSEETRHLIGERELRQMKPEAILVNTSRGPVVDEVALARALREKWITAAGIDVFEREPEVHPDLLACANAVLAPHVGSASVATRMKMATMAAENALAALEGKRPPNLVNPAAWR